MALVVEDGTGNANANAYVAVADVDTYATLRNQSSWAGYATAVKENAIVEATLYLDAHFTFLGTKVAYGQGLSWPRSAVYDTTEGVNVPSNVVPISLKRACMELALKVAAGTQLLEDLSHGGAVSSEKVGPIAVTYKDDSPNTTLFMITGLIKGLLRPDDPAYAPTIAQPANNGEQFFTEGKFQNTGDGLSPMGG